MSVILVQLKFSDDRRWRNDRWEIFVSVIFVLSKFSDVRFLKADR